MGRSSGGRASRALEELSTDPASIRQRVAEALMGLDLADGIGLLGLGSDDDGVAVTWSLAVGDERTRALAWRVQHGCAREAWKLVDLRDSPRAHRRRFHTLDELVPRERLIASPTWHAIYAPCDVEDQTRILLAHGQRAFAFAALLRYRGAGRFAPSGRRLQRLVAPVRRALIAADRAATHPDEPADFVLDPLGRVRFASAAGARWLEVPHFRDELTSLVRHTDRDRGGDAPQPAGPGSGAAMSIVRVAGDGGVRYLVHVAAPAPLRLTPVSSLSDAQREVARLAAAGATVAEIARMTDRRRETVRTHLRTVYRRLGVASRGELGQVLAGA